MDCMNKMKIVYGDGGIGLHGTTDGKTFSYLFGPGGPHSIKINDREWLYRPVRPTFWRAMTDNDKGNGFAYRSGMWLSADAFIRGNIVKFTVDGEGKELPLSPGNNRYDGTETAQKVKLVYEYETVTNPSAKVKVSYVTKADGCIKVKVHYYGVEGLAELPVMGMRFIAPTVIDHFTYEGLSGETYPDRMAGGIKGVYKISGLPVTPYLYPQDCGMHMNTKWVTLSGSTSLRNDRSREETVSLSFDLDGLAFSCLPYTALELENATHIEELPPKRRTVLCIYGAVRGVGGIDSWGADVEPQYHISGEEDIKFSFTVHP